MKRKLSAFVLSLVAILSCAPARADVVYSYVGPNFDYFPIPGYFTSADYISATFTFSQPLQPNLTFTPTTYQSMISQEPVVSWQITDGIHVWNNNDATLLDVLFATSSDGSITNWLVGATAPGPPGTNLEVTMASDCFPWGCHAACDLIDYSGVGIPNSTLYLGGTLEQGTWTLENLAQEKEGACSRH